MANNAESGKINDLINSFVARAHEELEIRLGKWPQDLSKQEFYDVVGALLARQVTLACNLALCPSIWNGHVAPLLLRAMADVYINISWVLKSPMDRSKQFIHYGLGQEKLQIEHHRVELEEREPKDGEIEALEYRESWINSQRAIFLTNVNFGSWSGISTREMALEAGCIDFYNYVYTPFSACVHSMWHHIAKYNLKECQNPLHRFHNIPSDVDVPLDPYYLYLAAKYFDKTLNTFDSELGISTHHQSAFHLLCEEFGEFKATCSD